MGTLEAVADFVGTRGQLFRRPNRFRSADRLTGSGDERAVLASEGVLSHTEQRRPMTPSLLCHSDAKGGGDGRGPPTWLSDVRASSLLCLFLGCLRGSTAYTRSEASGLLRSFPCKHRGVLMIGGLLSSAWWQTVCHDFLSFNRFTAAELQTAFAGEIWAFKCTGCSRFLLKQGAKMSDWRVGALRSQAGSAAHALAQGAPGTQKGYMAVVVAEGKCVWLHVGGGFWPRRPCRWGKVSWKGEERGSPLACNRDFVALHTARTGQWGQSLSVTFNFISKLSSEMIIADCLVCTNRSHDLVWVTNGTPKVLFRAAGARTLGLNWACAGPTPLEYRPHLFFLRLNPIVLARCASDKPRARSLQSRMRIEVSILATAAIRS